MLLTLCILMAYKIWNWNKHMQNILLNIDWSIRYWKEQDIYLRIASQKTIPRSALEISDHCSKKENSQLFGLSKSCAAYNIICCINMHAIGLVYTLTVKGDKIFQVLTLFSLASNSFIANLSVLASSTCVLKRSTLDVTLASNRL